MKLNKNLDMKTNLVKLVFGEDADLKDYNGFDDESLNYVFNDLSESDRDRFKYRIGLYDGKYKTLDETAEYFNVTKERIRQTEEKVIRKLRHPYRAKVLKYGLSFLRNKKAELEKEYVQYLAGLNLGGTNYYSNIQIEKLNISYRAYSCLKRAGINTLAELMNLSVYNLAKIRNLGQRCLYELIDFRDKIKSSEISGKFIR